MQSHPARSRSRYVPNFRTLVVRISRKLKAVYRIRTGRWLSRLLTGLLGAFIAQFAGAQVLPQGMQVQSGTVSVTRPNASSLVLNQSTNKAILDWQSFSIGQGGLVQFVQPGSASVALNRVVGNELSSIFGTLSANGQVFLVNPAGVLFAPGASVNVGGLVASTLNMSNADFLAGRYVFEGPNGAGSIVNNGAIRAGYVMFAAPQVTNNGSINATNIGLMAGSKVIMDPNGEGMVKFKVDAAAVKAAVENTGMLTAEGGQVALSAQAIGDTLSTVVSNKGVIKANTVENRDGVIVLSGGNTGVVKNSGTLQAAGTAPGQKGGTVKVLGERVGLMADSLIDVSGFGGGGTVLVGGNWQGKGPEQNAKVTFFDKSASVRADAIDNGNGGTVVIWSDQTTRAAGTISAKGGAQGGDGGKVEVSGKETLQYDATVDTTAAKGAKGSLLLDPLNIDIVNGASGTGAHDAGVTDDGSFVAATDPTSTITNGAIVATLNTTNVTLSATDNININSGAAIDASGNGGNAGSLTLNSTGGSGTITIGADINLNASSAPSGAGNFTANATSTGSITLGANVTTKGTQTYAGAVTLGAATDPTLQGNAIVFNQTVDAATKGAEGLAIIGKATFNGNVGVATELGSLSVTGTTTLGSGTSTIRTDSTGGGTGNQSYSATMTLGSGTTTLAATGSGGISTARITGADKDLVVNVAGTSTISGAIQTGAGTVTKEGAGNLTLSGNSTYTGQTTINGGTLIAASNNALGSADSGTTVNSGASLQFAVGNYSTAEAVTLETGSAIGVSSGSRTFAGTVVLDGDATANVAGGTLTLSGGVSGGGNLTKAGAGTLALAGSAANTASGTTHVNAGTLTLNKDTAGTAAIGGDLKVNGGTVTLSKSGMIADTSTVEVAGGTLNIGANDETVARVKLTSGSITGTSGVLTSTNTIDARDGSASAILGGSNGLDKTTTGTVTLSRANVYTGGTNVSDGTLALGNATAAGSGSISIGATGSLAVNATGVNNQVTVANGGTITNTSGSGSLTGPVALDGDAKVSSSGAGLTINGAIDDSGSDRSITSTGGNVTLAAANSYGGGTHVSAGTLALGHADAAGSGSIAVDGGARLAVNATGVNNTVTVAANGTLTNTAGTGSLSNSVTLAGNANLSSTGTGLAINGSIGGAAGSVTATGGNVTLGSANSHGGGTSVTGGTLTLAHGNAAGGGDINVGTGATLNINAATVANDVAMAAGATIKGTGSAQLDGTLGLGGSTTVNTRPWPTR